jgi:hypothetical protein
MTEEVRTVPPIALASELPTLRLLAGRDVGV